MEIEMRQVKSDQLKKYVGTIELARFGKLKKLAHKWPKLPNTKIPFVAKLEIRVKLNQCHGKKIIRL